MFDISPKSGFSPEPGDFFLEIINEDSSILIWRGLQSPHIKKAWPEDSDHSCPHLADGINWAFDAERRPVSLCDKCGSFTYGHKEEENCPQ